MKRTICLLIVLALCLCMSMPVFAAELAGYEGGPVAATGDDAGNNLIWVAVALVASAIGIVALLVLGAKKKR